MKRIVLIIAVCVLGITLSQAQPCTPNPMYADSTFGIWPSTWPNADPSNPSGYNLVIDLKTLTDTCLSNPTMCLYIQAMRITSIDGLPSGFVAAEGYNGTVGGSDGWVNGGVEPNYTPVQGCIIISAPQSAVQAAAIGNYPITIHLDLYAKNQDPNSLLLSNYTWVSTIGTGPAYTYNLAIGNTPPPPVCNYGLYFQGNPTSYAGLSSAAGSFDIDVEATDTSCNWDVIGGGSWLSYSPASGTGNGTIHFTYDANATGTGRFEQFTIGGLDYLVSQMMDTCTVNVSGLDSTIMALGGTSLFTVTVSNTDCFWNLVTRSYCDWVHISPEYGTGTTSVTLTVDPNPDNQVRQCELDFGNGVTYTVNQSATVGLNETKATVFDLYPNPANDFVTIATPAITGKEVVSIYTIAGQLLSQTQLTNTKQQISTTDLANGMYVFSVQNAQGIAGRKKVVINR